MSFPILNQDVDRKERELTAIGALLQGTVPLVGVDAHKCGHCSYPKALELLVKALAIIPPYTITSKEQKALIKLKQHVWLAANMVKNSYHGNYYVMCGRCSNDMSMDKPFLIVAINKLLQLLDHALDLPER